MTGRLAGKTAFITSAGQGIGRSAALMMANEGASVFATDLREDGLLTLGKEHPAIRTAVARHRLRPG